MACLFYDDEVIHFPFLLINITAGKAVEIHPLASAELGKDFTLDTIPESLKTTKIKVIDFQTLLANEAPAFNTLLRMLCRGVTKTMTEISEITTIATETATRSC